MRLLVAYLATTGGADAISVGVRLARTLGARLDVCMVVPRDRTAPLLPAANYDEVLVEQSEQWLTEAVDLVPTDVEVTTHVVLHDSAAQGLLDEAERLGAAALVVGGSGGGMAGSHSLGSVVNELLHASSVPVVLAPRGARHSTAVRVREITCAIGTLPGSTELLDAAVRVSADGSLPLRLVSLVGLDRSDDPSRVRATAHAQETLDKAVAALPPATSVTACVAEGTSVESAVDSLDWRDGDLIMVGSSRLAQPRRLFLGSTAAKMLRVLAVPMVVVPRHDG
ncbi:universal stress protein [Gordonia sp. SL306]|uniref:universal stress protein n=1 Tax=Gordonia sp. SL306 TaxID=2995145 RepID=UPI00226EAA73|nr:universal stress protein [Gordonia sp. SL306]WAC54936.1 universal stress protein [Gordonia sp. SL306]